MHQGIRLPLARAAFTYTDGSTISRPSWGCRSYWPRWPRRATSTMSTRCAHAGVDKEPRIRVRGPPLSRRQVVRRRVQLLDDLLEGYDPQHQATTENHQPGCAQPEEGGQAVRLGRVSAEGPDRGRLWSRGEQGAPTTLQVVRTDNHLRFAKGRAIAWNVRAPGRFEWANRLKVPIPSYGGQQTHTVRLTLPACGRACSVAESRDDSLADESPGGATCRNRRELRTNLTQPSRWSSF